MGAEIQDGAVLVARAILNSSLWTMRAEDRLVAITCICLANWKPRGWFNGKEQMTIERGQFVRSWEHLAEACKLSVQCVRTSVQHLENVGFLTRKLTGHVQLFTLRKYEHYQDLTKYSDQIAAESNKVPNSPLTATQQQVNSDLTTNNKVIREEGKNDKDIAATAAPLAREVTEDLIKLWNVGKAAKEWIRITPKRIAKTQARLKDGFTREQLYTAVGNCLKSEWHQGANDRGWKAPGPEWVLHTTEKVEQWIHKTSYSAPTMTKEDLMKEMTGG